MQKLVRAMAELVVICVVVSLGSEIPAQTPLTTELVADGLRQPVFVASPPGDRDRLFIVEQAGLIKILRGGEILPTPFANLIARTRSSGERGLLGLAFHPRFADNGIFYVNYTQRIGGATVVEKFRVSIDDPDVADPESLGIVAGPIAQPFGNHNGGCIAFGPDGHLYIGMGDGGSGGDPFCLAQKGDSLLGKMLRIDEDGGVPADNPFVDDPAVADEIWSFGLRNPWRFSFDRETGDLYIADVGQSRREEISVQPGASPGGENYGWKPMEGNNCFSTSSCPASTPGCNDPSLTLPIHEYDHGQGCSVTGGYVYRGCAIPDLEGLYFFADFCRASIWSLRYDGTTAQDLVDRTAELRPSTGRIDQVSSFGEDADGEIYVVDRGGEVFKIVPDAPSPAEDLGFGKVGSNGKIPELSTCGLLTPGSRALLRVRHAPPDARAGLYISESADPEPRFGGTLVPAAPAHVVRLQTSADGTLEFEIPGEDQARVRYVQFVFDDPDNSAGRGLSNALRLTWHGAPRTISTPPPPLVIPAKPPTPLLLEKK